MAVAPKIVFGSTLILLFAGASFYGAQRISHQRDQLRAARNGHNALIQELAKTRRQIAADLTAAEDLQRHLDAMPASESRVETETTPVSAETKLWLTKLATAKRLFAEHPEAALPEFQLLNIRAWLGAIKGVEFDTEEHTRKGLAAIRTVAKKEFTMWLSFALRKYVNATNGELPQDLTALVPYFDRPIDPAILERYKMVRTGNLTGVPNSMEPVILEKAPIDEDFDSRQGLQVSRMSDGTRWGAVQGSFGGLGPAAWIDGYEERVQRARAEFTRANPGTSTPRLGQLAPYFDPPIDPAKLEKLIARETAPPQK
jgi:hypothetical protein